jgi:hypothetical protein
MIVHLSTASHAIERARYHDLYRDSVSADRSAPRDEAASTI